jgi:O-succinylbenzoic acid--CoA ligase
MGEANPLSIERAARQAPDRIALVIDGQGSHRYAELAARARALAASLRHQLADEARIGARVAIVADARLETIVALLACWEQGWTPALIHPRLTADERARSIGELAPALVLDEGFALEARQGAASGEASAGDQATPAALVYTSGTAGPARAAILSRSAFAASARASEANLGWREDDRWLLSMPLAHVGGLSVLTRALMARRTAVLARVQVAAPERLIDVVARHRVTLASLVPTQLQALFDAEPSHRPPAHLRAILLGGAASSSALLATAAERGFPVLATYGLTEACSQVATQVAGTRPGPEQGCGPPLAGVRVRIEDGEIQIAGPTLMTGYLAGGAPPLCPLVDGEWFATGDLGRFDDAGRLHVQGRRKELIITGGENVHPLEVERALEACTAVAAACAFGVPDAVWGEVLAAAVVARDPHIDDAALRAIVLDHAERALAPHRRPRRIARLPALVTTEAGKLDRRATADRALPRLVELWRESR